MARGSVSMDAARLKNKQVSFRLTQPIPRGRLTEHHRVQTVDVGYEDGWREEEEEDVSDEEVRAPQRQLDDLHDELARRLRHRGRAQAAAVPLARPPRPVRLIVLELTREEDGDEDLVDRALYEDDRDETEHGVCDVPQLEEPLHIAVSKHPHVNERRNLRRTRRTQPCQ